MKIFITLICLIFTGCASDTNMVTEKPVPDKKNIEATDDKSSGPDISLGWSDEDTYIVKVISKDIDSAIDAARYKILHDIVKIRMINQSRFTDISKISQEFDKPLRNGEIIKERPVSEGVEIYYQIRDKGLKQKFQRK
jgi:PBP1b-binding outer membrane lipoprotein LpoB